VDAGNIMKVSSRRVGGGGEVDDTANVGGREGGTDDTAKVSEAETGMDDTANYGGREGDGRHG